MKATRVEVGSGSHLGEQYSIEFSEDDLAEPSEAFVRFLREERPPWLNASALKEFTRQVQRRYARRP